MSRGAPARCVAASFPVTVVMCRHVLYVVVVWVILSILIILDTVQLSTPLGVLLRGFLSRSGTLSVACKMYVRCVKVRNITSSGPIVVLILFQYVR